jgi:signal transduction histidine kinase
MAVELAQVAAGLPVAASFALAGGITSLREGRRRAALNEAMHELRRPLQVLNLALPDSPRKPARVESSLELATVALERLDREINGSPLERVVAEVSVDELIEEAVRRWKRAATDSGASLKKEWNGPATFVQGDRFDLAQALDNLLSNAIEHGRGEVRIGWRRDRGHVCISVHNSGVRKSPGEGSKKGRRGSRSRRGHGLRVVKRIARRHGGSFALQTVRGGAKASLRLPLARRVDAR